MARQVQQLNYSSFSGGLITEASPLTFPDGASIEENNFELTKQGFRRRRLGLDSISQEVQLNEGSSNPRDVVTFLWDNNGNTGQEFLAVAIRNELVIYDVTEDIPGDRPVYQTTIKGSSKLSLTSHAGQLIIANGEHELTIIRALGDNLFTERKERLQIRDRVGIPDYSRDTDTNRKISLLNAAKAGYRPTSDELYLDPAYTANPVIVPTPPAEVSYVFTGIRQISNDGNTVRHQLDSAVEFEEFQGYPIAEFILESAGTERRFTIVFRDVFYKQSIEATQQTNDFALQEGGLKFTANLTQAEYNAYFGLTKDLFLMETNSEHHPHIYNLWNQGWGEKRMTSANATTLIDPLDNFHENTNLIPANADNLNSVLYPNNQHDTNRTADRFHWQDLEANPIGSSVAPQGRFIIDALDRGASRNAAFLKDLQDKGSTRTSDTNLNFEYTTGGATTVAEYAGRVWYAGFSGDSAGSTIQMSNKILYGQVSDDNLLSCYQETDPTSKDDSDLVDTDGGWVSIDGIDEVIKLVPTDTSLVVFATNGVWVIAGTDGNTFSPTASMVAKITDKGAVNSQNMVQVDSNIFFWARDGLYVLLSEGFATFKIQSLTKGTINNIVLGLTQEDFEGMSGAYDERADRLIWVIDGEEGATERRVLIYHLDFQCFTINTLYKGMNGFGAKEVLSVVRTPQFFASDITDNIIAGSDNVVAGSDNVVAEGIDKVGQETRTIYLTIRVTDTGNYLSFANPVREDFRDWGEVDAEAHLLTGYVSGGDHAREKQVPYLTMHCNRTEDVATETGVTKESSCLVQAQWNWTNSAAAGQWGPTFQAYRLGRPQIRGVGQPVAEGEQVVTTKSKLRGRGKVVSLLISTEPEKDCQVLGWSMIAGVNGNVQV